MKLTGLWQQKSKMIIKLWLNQFAFSLFGLFVATPFSGNLCVAAGIFSFLFYLSVVGYAIIDDAQKDKISYEAGRIEGKRPYTGLLYSFFAFLPTLIISIVFTAISFGGQALNAAKSILFIILKYALAGEILGIDVGLAKFTYSAELQAKVSSAPEIIQLMSNHAVFQLIFAIVVPLLFAFIYYLGFSGKVSINTTISKKKK